MLGMFSQFKVARDPLIHELELLRYAASRILHTLALSALVSRSGGMLLFSLTKLLGSIFSFLCRQEMQHFVSIFQGYLMTEVMEVTWSDFLQQLDDVECFSAVLDMFSGVCILFPRVTPLMASLSVLTGQRFGWFETST